MTPGGLDLQRAAPAPRPVRLAILVEHSRALSAGVVAQAVSSASNFALGLVLMRWLPQAEYGVYGIGASVCVLYGGLGNALLLTQMVVRTSEKPERERRAYAARVLAMVAALGAVTVAVVGAVAVVATLLASTSGGAVTLALAFTGAAVASLLRDFFVRHAYTARAAGRAITVTSVTAFGIAVLLALASPRRASLTAAGALLIFAGAQLAGAAVGLAKAHLPLRHVDWARARQEWRESWTGGVWAVGGVAVTWAQTQAYAYVALLGLGAASVGRANAGRLLVMPVFLLTTAVHQVMMPRFADLRARRPQDMVRQVRTATRALLAVASLFSAALLALPNGAFRTLFGPAYGDMRGLLAAWCAVLVASISREGASTALVTLKRFRELTTTQTLAAPVSLISALALIRWWGAAGAVLGTAAAEVVLGCLQWRRIAHARPALG